MDDEVVAGRSCGRCNLCCKVMGVRGVDKAPHVWCRHAKAGAGCGIYADRPQDCRDFHCAWLTSANFGEHWAPVRSKMIVNAVPSIPRLEIHVDGGRPNAWRDEPYYSELKAWARAAVPDEGEVIVYLPDRAIMILPQKDVDLGRRADIDGMMLAKTVTMTRDGPVIDVDVVRRADGAPAPAL